MRSRPALSPGMLVFVGLGVGLVVIDWATPSGPRGPVVGLLVTLATFGLHATVIAAAYPRVEARLSSHAVLLVMTAISAVVGATIAVVLWWLSPDLFQPTPPSSAAVGVGGAVTGTLLLGLYVLLVHHPRALDEARALRLESELASLRARLEPHFLLNSLNAIAATVAEDPRRARRAIAALGEILTDALERTTDRAHTVDGELSWLRAYLTIFETRYGDALSITWDVAPGLGALPLPRLLLQPLVENAVVHGLATTSTGHLAISVREEGRGALTFEIANTGPSVAAADIVDGHGLALFKRRLALEVPGARLRLAPGPDGGMVATVVFPAGRR